MKVKINALLLVCVLICNIFYVQVFADSEIQSYSENTLKTGVSHLFTFSDNFVPTGVAVNGQSTENYQYIEGMILVDGSVFESAGDYTIAVTDGTNTLSTTVTISSRAEILYMPFENNDGNQSSNLCFNEYVDKDDDYANDDRTQFYTGWKRSGSVFNIGDVKYCSAFIQQFYGRAYLTYNINQTGKYDVYYSTGNFSSNVNCTDVGIDIKTTDALTSVVLTKAEQSEFKLIASDVEFAGKSDKSEYIKFYRPATITKGALGVGVVKLLENIAGTAATDAFYTKVMSTFNVMPSVENVNELYKELSFNIGLTAENKNYFDKDNAVIYADNVRVENAVVNTDGTFTIPANTFNTVGKHEIAFKVSENVSVSAKCEIMLKEPTVPILTPFAMNENGILSDALFFFEEENSFDAESCKVYIDGIEISKENYSIKNRKLLIHGVEFGLESEKSIKLVTNNNSYICTYKVKENRTLVTTKDTTYVDVGSFVSASTFYGPETSRAPRVQNSPKDSNYAMWKVEQEGVFLLDVWLLRSNSDEVCPVTIEVADKNGIRKFENVHYTNYGYGHNSKTSDLYAFLKENGVDAEFEFSGKKDGSEYIKIYAYSYPAAQQTRLGADSYRLYNVNKVAEEVYELDNNVPCLTAFTENTDIYKVKMDVEFNLPIESTNLESYITVMRNGVKENFAISPIDGGFELTMDNDRDYKSAYMVSVSDKLKGLNGEEIKVKYEYSFVPTAPVEISYFTAEKKETYVKLATNIKNNTAAEGHKYFVTLALYNKAGEMIESKFFKGIVEYKDDIDINTTFDLPSEEYHAECIIIYDLVSLKQMFETLVIEEQIQ